METHLPDIASTISAIPEDVLTECLSSPFMKGRVDSGLSRIKESDYPSLSTRQLRLLASSLDSAGVACGLLNILSSDQCRPYVPRDFIKHMLHGADIGVKSLLQVQTTVSAEREY